MTSALGPFLAASAAACLGCWGLFELIQGETFMAGPSRLPMIYVLPPLAALALFQLVFSGMSGRWRGWRFWAVAAPFATAVWGLGLVSVLTGYATIPTALGAVVLAHLAFGLFSLTQTAGAR